MVGRIAQSVEQRTENPCVAGSIPAPATTSIAFIKINAPTKSGALKAVFEGFHRISYTINGQ
jgi:hypothetical protein